MFKKKEEEIIPETDWEKKFIKEKNERLLAQNRLLMEAVKKAGYTIEIIDGDQISCLEMSNKDKKILFINKI